MQNRKVTHKFSRFGFKPLESYICSQCIKTFLKIYSVYTLPGIEFTIPYNENNLSAM